MDVIKVTPRGYCKGVTRAISLAKKTIAEHPGKQVYILGMLVHNRYVMEALAQQHVIAIDDKKKTRMELLDAIPSGSIVIFTAHGVSPNVIEKAKQKNLIFVDASCPDVVKTQHIVRDQLDKGMEVLYIGKAAHPEAEAITSLSSHVHLITSKEDIEALLPLRQVFVTNQTTMSIFDVEELFDTIRQYCPSAIFSEEICNATRIRQQAVVDLKHQQIDVLYVVGDTHSNNSNRLAQIAKEQGIQQVYLIDDVAGVCWSHVSHAKRVAVTSGASTPTYLTTQVVSYLEHMEENSKQPCVDISQIL